MNKFILLLLICLSINLHAQELPTERIDCPVQKGGEPNLYTSPQGDVYLSWIDYASDEVDVLMFSKMVNNKWSKAKEIARGNNWFVNWADFPSLVVYKNEPNQMAAHWLQKRSDGTYDYDIYISQSIDGGETWLAPFILHSDGVAAEHGFVSLEAAAEGKIFATWLDGRNTKTGEQDHTHGEDHGHHHGGAMTLRTAYFDIKGQVSEETLIDNKVCDCCQTAATIFGDEIFVAYRDRSDEEVRDISFAVLSDSTWSKPQSVHQDNWSTKGCPVNGPMLSSFENKSVAVSWYTSAIEPTVNIAFYNTDQKAFSRPVRVDNGMPLGRVGIVSTLDGAFVTWLEQLEDGSAEMKIISVSQNGEKGIAKTICKMSSARSSGFPQMALAHDKLIYAWVVEVGESTTIKTAKVHLY